MGELALLVAEHYADEHYDLMHVLDNPNALSLPVPIQWPTARDAERLADVLPSPAWPEFRIAASSRATTPAPPRRQHSETVIVLDEEAAALRPLPATITDERLREQWESMSADPIAMKIVGGCEPLALDRYWFEWEEWWRLQDEIAQLGGMVRAASTLSQQARLRVERRRLRTEMHRTTEVLRRLETDWGLSPVGRLRLGVLIQRTRALEGRRGSRRRRRGSRRPHPAGGVVDAGFQELRPAARGPRAGLARHRREHRRLRGPGRLPRRRRGARGRSATPRCATRARPSRTRCGRATCPPCSASPIRSPSSWCASTSRARRRRSCGPSTADAALVRCLRDALAAPALPPPSSPAPGGRRCGARPSTATATPCQRCGAPCPHPAHHDVDHVVPLRRGGSSNLENLRTLCRACHTLVR